MHLILSACFHQYNWICPQGSETHYMPSMILIDMIPLWQLILGGASIPHVVNISVLLSSQYGPEQSVVKMINRHTMASVKHLSQWSKDPLTSGFCCRNGYNRVKWQCRRRSAVMQMWKHLFLLIWQSRHWLSGRWHVNRRKMCTYVSFYIFATTCNSELFFASRRMQHWQDSEVRELLGFWHDCDVEHDSSGEEKKTDSSAGNGKGINCLFLSGL